MEVTLPTLGRCPRCLRGRLRTWDELRPEQQELVRRLPLSATVPFALRQAAHLWCRYCWHEQAAPEQLT